MDTLAFFQATLPAVGPYYGVLFHDKGKTHKSCPTLESLVEFVDKYKDNPRFAVYHACASYKEPSVEINGKKKWRVAENWGQARSFWMDIDCHPEKAAKGEGYESKPAGFAALKIFCAKVGLPLPMIVDSGNGLHTYWPLTKPIGPNAWRKLSAALKELTRVTGFLADNSRTADLSSILRPPTTVNRKREPRVVTVKRECEPMAPEMFATLIRAAVDKLGVLPPKLPADAGINADLLAHVPEPLPSSAETIASKCQQVAQMRDTLGDVGYEHWRGVIGIIKHCTEGVELAVEWSTRRAETGHGQTDTEAKYESWSANPTTCEFFDKHNSGGCDGCEFKGKIKSPIVLGREIPVPTEQTVVAEVEGKAVDVQMPAPPMGYAFGPSGTVRIMKDPDGIPHQFPISPLIFYPTHRVRNETGSYNLNIRAHLPRGKVREFLIPTASLESRSDLMKALGDKEVMAAPTEKAPMHLSAYLKESLQKLMREADEINTMTSFGWHYDMQAFLIGDRLFHRDGSVRKVLVGGYAADQLKAFPAPTGTLEGYASPLNDIYGRPGMEPMQYAIMSGFGSILTPMGEELYHGLLVALTGGRTGKGKTSVCWAALYAFGDASALTMGSEQGATINARWGLMGTYKSLPMLFDEITHIEPTEFSRTAYAISNGKDKTRLISGAAGTRFATQHTWKMSPYATANKDLHALLSSMQSNSEAEAVRIIQIRIDKYNIPKLGESEVSSAIAQMGMNKGVAGELFIRHVVANFDDVYSTWRSVMADVEQHIPGQQYRHYRNHAACTLTALQITNHLGITEFDYDTVFNFTIKLMRELCESVKENNNATPGEAFNRMVTELTPRIVRTNEFRDGRDKSGPEDVPVIREAIAGRYIAGTGSKADSYAGHLYIVRKDFRDWCSKNRVEPDELVDFIKEREAWIEVSDKFTLTRGTPLPVVQTRCIGVDLNKLAGVMLGGPRLVAPKPMAEPVDGTA